METQAEGDYSGTAGAEQLRAPSGGSWKGAPTRAPLLIVDDDRRNLLAFEAVLQDPRHEIILAESGREALAQVETREFAAILLDVRMPDLNGYDTAALIRRRAKSKATPILFMTAFDAPAQEVSDAYGVGGTDFIRKPVDDVVLRSKVRPFVDLYLDRLEARNWGRDLVENAERRLRLILEQLPVNLCAVNRDLRITFADGIHVRAQGRSAGAIVGRKVTDFVIDEERAAVEAAFKGALAGRSTAYETHFEGRSYSAHVQPLLGREQEIISAICGFLDVTDLKNAERRARENQNLQEALFRAASDAIFVKDAAGRFLLVNDAGARCFGKPVEEVIGKTAGDLLPEAAACACAESDRGVMESGQPVVLEETVQLPDGAHSFRFSKAPLRDADGKTVGLVGVAHDVTDLVRAREQLRASDERFRLAMRATNEVIWDWDVRTGDVTWSGAVAKLLDCETVPSPFPIEFARSLWLEKLHPEDRDRVLENFQRHLKDGAETWSMEYRHRRPDGRTPWMLDRAIILRDEAGAPVRVVGALLEITRQKESEEALARLNKDLESRVKERAGALQRTQERLGLALEGAGMGTWDFEIDSGRVEWSDTFSRLLGYVPGSPPPSREAWESRVHPEDRDRVRAEVERAKKAGGRYQVEYRILRADTNEVRWIVSRGHVTLDEGGRALRLAGVSFDSTDRRQAQEALEASLEESSAFAGTVAHELRVPLRAMGTTAQLLLEDYGSAIGGDGRAMFDRLIAAAQRLDTMTTDLLAFSRQTREQVTLEPVDLAKVVAGVLQEMREDLDRREARVDLLGSFPPVVANAASLTHALSNLLYNAIKFVAPGVSPRIRIRAERHGGRVRLWVEDNGIGISARDQERLFQVFERLAPDYPGTGVGLAIVRKCVERMRGKVGVESRAGEGSRFYIDLAGSETGRG